MNGYASLTRQLVAAVSAGGEFSHLQVPEAGRLAWQWFHDLHAARSWSSTGPNPISFEEILAWSRLSGWPVAQRHILLIRAMDNAWLTAYHDRRKQQSDTTTRKLPPRSAHAVSPALFDTMFG